MRTPGGEPPRPTSADPCGFAPRASVAPQRSAQQREERCPVPLRLLGVVRRRVRWHPAMPRVVRLDRVLYPAIAQRAIEPLLLCVIETAVFLRAADVDPRRDPGSEQVRAVGRIGGQPARVVRRRRGDAAGKMAGRGERQPAPPPLQ